MSKKIVKGNSGMIEGINLVAETIKVTLGPKGKCVAIQSSFGGPEVTRDGATVAKSISPEDPAVSMGAELIKAASIRTEEMVGDGTSSTAILAQDMVNTGSAMLARESWINVNEYKEGMELALEAVKKYIASKAIPVGDDAEGLERVRRVATVSANNDSSVGDLIVECMKKVGQDGVITADRSSGLDTVIEVTQGFKVERGWASPHFVNSAKDGKCTLENPVILVVSERLSSIPPLVPVIEGVAKQGRSLLVIADEVDEVVLNMLAFNSLQGALKCCVIKGIDFGDSRKNIMEDIAVSVGASQVCPEYGLTLAKATLEHLGSADKVVISKDSAVIYGGAGDPARVADRLEVLKERLADPKTSPYEKSKFKTRVAALSGGVAVIKAGGASETEQANRKATIEDAILASQSAHSEGISAGGGWTLYQASVELSKTTLSDNRSVQAGVDLVLGSLQVISETIATNYGEPLERVRAEAEKGWGFNAKTGLYENLLESGVLDSAKVLRVELENAVSAAAMCLLTETMVIEVPESTECGCGKH